MEPQEKAQLHVPVSSGRQDVTRNCTFFLDFTSWACKLTGTCALSLM